VFGPPAYAVFWAGTRTLDSIEDLVQFADWISKPVCGTDAVNLPVKSFQYRLSQAIPIARRTGIVVRGAIPLNTQHIAPWSFPIDNGEVEKGTGATNLRMHNITSSRQRVQYLLFEDRILGTVRLHRNINFAGGSIAQECF
jgi:hypothetical protein